MSSFDKDFARSGNSPPHAFSSISVNQTQLLQPIIPSAITATAHHLGQLILRARDTGVAGDERIRAAKEASEVHKGMGGVGLPQVELEAARKAEWGIGAGVKLAV